MSPGIHVRAAVTWLAVYPLITAALVLTEPVLGGAPLPVQTLVLTAVVVPLAVYAAVPLLLRLAGPLLVRPSGPHVDEVEEDHA